MSETWTERLINSALKIQSRISGEVPLELKEAGRNRNAKLVVEGDDGGTFFLRWTGEELVREEDPSDVRNEFFMHSQTLLDLLSGELEIREAAAARLIRVTGDRSLYDSEDILQLLEKLREKIVKAIQEKQFA
jgi:putative sterol carrier protein